MAANTPHGDGGGKAQAAEMLQPVLQRAAAARNSLVAWREQARLYKSILEISILAGSLLLHRKALAEAAAAAELLTSGVARGATHTRRQG